MKFTVFGATGFIGRHLARRLIRRGHEVAVPTRSEIPHLPQKLGHVIYAIGLTSDFRTRPFDTITAHVTLLADLMQKYSFDSFLYLSSTRVYTQEPTHENVVLSVNPYNRSDLYNLSKLTGEAICLNSGCPQVRVARLANVIGEASLQPDTFVGEICAAANSGEINLRSAIETRKDYIWIDDVTELLINIAIRGASRVYNVASGQQVSHQDLVAALARLTNCRVNVETNAPDLSFPAIDISRISQEFSFKPTSVLSRLSEIVGNK